MNKNLTLKTYSQEVQQLISQKHYKEALLKCSRGASLDPHNSAIYIAWGIALFAVEDLDKAAFKFAKAIQIKPNDGRAYYNYSGIHYYMGKYEQAAEYSRKAYDLSSNPKFLQFWGMILQNQGKYDEALVKWDEIIRANPRAPIPYICCCVTYYCNDQPSEARALLE